MNKVLLFLIILALMIATYLYVANPGLSSNKQSEIEISNNKNQTVLLEGEETVISPTEELTDHSEESLGTVGAQSKTQQSNAGIDLSIDTRVLEHSYQVETLEDYGWKSYWENELYVILMDSSRNYPFVSQETHCKAKTCKIEVRLSTDKIMYMKQAVASIDKEFDRRNVPLSISKIDVQNGVIGFYVQPGGME